MMDKAFRQLPVNASFRLRMSSSQEVTTLIEVIKALNPGALIPSALALALLWKLYGFFNDLSEKLTRIETKIDALKDLLPYKIKEFMEHENTTKAKGTPQKHNPAIEKADWLETIGVAFGLVDVLIFFAVFLQSSIVFDNIVFWLLFLVPGILGLLPIIISEKTIAKERRAGLSLLSLVPWIYLVLVLAGVISPIL
jgi:hypothetical protein